MEQKTLYLQGKYPIKQLCKNYAVKSIFLTKKNLPKKEQLKNQQLSITSDEVTNSGPVMIQAFKFGKVKII